MNDSWLPRGLLERGAVGGVKWTFLGRAIVHAHRSRYTALIIINLKSPWSVLVSRLWREFVARC